MIRQTKLRVLIVDDDARVRRQIRIYLRRLADYVVAGECRNGEEALAAITLRLPDILFLNIQMPSLSGFDFVRKLQTLETPPPAIIFVTDYDNFAVQAFDVMAVNYLLKPFSQTMFEQALQRVRVASAGSARQSMTTAFNAPLARPQQSPDKGLTRLLVHDGGRIEVVLTKDIRWIGAANNYVELHTTQKKHLLRKTLGELETELGPMHFVRIHRSTIVNIRYVRTLRPLCKRDHAVMLIDGTELIATRTFFDGLVAALTEP